MKRSLGVACILAVCSLGACATSDATTQKKNGVRVCKKTTLTGSKVRRLICRGEKPAGLSMQQYESGMHLQRIDDRFGRSDPSVK